jgi:hypothetical protein
VSTNQDLQGASRGNRGGPSPRTIAWRRFVIETLLCVVLVAVIVAIALQARHDVLASPAIVALTGAVVAIVQRRW